MATGILLTARDVVGREDEWMRTNREAILALLVGSILFWIGCIVFGLLLSRGLVAISGTLAVIAALAVPWLLHALRVRWWSYYVPIPAFTVFISGLIQLALVVVRGTTTASSRIISSAFPRAHWRVLCVFMSSILIWLVLALPIYVCARIWGYQPGDLLSSSTFPARFGWDSTHGVTTFRLEDGQLGERVGGRAWSYVVALQIKPYLDSFLRSSKLQRATGWGLVKVGMAIPLAIDEGWGSDGLELDTDVSPLMHAAKKGDVESVKKLLAEGAEVSARDWMDNTALIYACGTRHSNPQVVALLLSAGSDPNAANKGGETALMGAATGPWAEDQTLIILRSLLAAGARPNVKGRSGGTALMEAAALGEMEAVKALLKAGADPSAQDNSGLTAMSLAAQHNHSEVVQILEKWGRKRGALRKTGDSEVAR